MPTISFDTIEHSEVTGMETTHHEYHISEEFACIGVYYWRDGIFIRSYYKEEAQQLIDTLIHDKTKSPTSSKAKSAPEFAHDGPTDKRQGYLVGTSDGAQGVIPDDAMSGVYATAQLRCFE